MTEYVGHTFGQTSSGQTQCLVCMVAKLPRASAFSDWQLECLNPLPDLATKHHM